MINILARYTCMTFITAHLVLVEATHLLQTCQLADQNFNE